MLPVGLWRTNIATTPKKHSDTLNVWGRGECLHWHSAVPVRPARFQVKFRVVEKTSTNTSKLSTEGLGWGFRRAPKISLKSQAPKP